MPTWTPPAATPTRVRALGALVLTVVLTATAGCASPGEQQGSSTGTSSGHVEKHDDGKPKEASDLDALCAWIMDDPAVQNLPQGHDIDSGTVTASAGSLGDKSLGCFSRVTVVIAQSSDPQVLEEMERESRKVDKLGGDTSKADEVAGVAGRYDYAEETNTEDDSLSGISASFDATEGDRSVLVGYIGFGAEHDSMTEADIREALAALLKKALEVPLPPSVPES